jgi:hypothetical protein
MTKLTDREPTQEMIAIAQSLDLGEDQWDYAKIWRAMHDAAPHDAAPHDAALIERLKQLYTILLGLPTMVDDVYCEAVYQAIQKLQEK